MAETRDAPVGIVERLGEICEGFPDAYEEDAWVGTRWRIRKRTFAHVLTIVSGVPASYAEAVGDDGPVTVMTFRAAGPELAALTTVGHPFFKAQWGHDVVGIVLDEDETDWDEVAELLAESYCIMAPKGLARRLRESLVEQTG
ncbi:MmcQ/YjbR family DNA-binding protein [Kribbella monticola]|uniref:MmcQ/YjbR family DNA-binding protein n=1 Tax=Kribbella monticola TaxID=2185285 RepID=UPI000DD423D5|nr:MmcQ/YjbR family DNA-binding protein [Kribbella monticola]